MGGEGGEGESLEGEERGVERVREKERERVRDKKEKSEGEIEIK